MAVIECKMCGGHLNITEGATVVKCEYCGRMQTVPTADSEKKLTLLERANRLRLACEFDKAAGVYEGIVAEFPEEAEAYWGLVLCRYGIEYVDDPATGKKVPTCHRSSFDSILENVDYLAAVERADVVARRQYEQDGKEIEDVRRGILSLSQKEAPYDVFLCYKESDDQGRRTLDSQRAQEIYYQLTDQGRRVFFARVTLEDKAGQQYEPYIFAALNSAKVMLVIGTRREHLEAVWVKNEWSRYLALMKQDRKKLLIPCYSEMDPYDMPEQLSVLQSYDMTRIGFIQDLTRGIAKVLDADKKPETTVIVQETVGGNVSALLKRGNMALEDGEWEKADGFFEDVLNQDPECAGAYAGKALAGAKCRDLKTFVQARLAGTQKAGETELSIAEATDHIAEMVKKYALPDYFDEIKIRGLYKHKLTFKTSVSSREEQKKSEENYWKNHKQLSRAMKFARDAYKEELDSEYRRLMQALDERVAKAREQEKNNETILQNRYAAFLTEIDAKVEELHARALEQREGDYRTACGIQENASSINEYNKAIAAFDVPGLKGYKDSGKRIEQCRKEIERIRAEQAAEAERQRARAEQEAERQRLLAEKEAARRRKHGRMIAIFAGAAAALVVAVIVVVTQVVIPAGSYGKAEALLASGDGAKAAVAFGALGNYRDARERSMSLWSSAAARDTISAGKAHTVGLKANGAVVAVGDYGDGQLEVTGWTNIVAVTAGDWHTVGLKADGAVAAVGTNTFGQCRISGWRDIVAIAAGNDHTVGLKADGAVVAVGYNEYDQCEVSGWRDIVAIAAGNGYTVGLRADGTVVAVGDNHSGQCDVADWTGIAAIAAGDQHTVGLKTDGTVVAAGNDTDDQCKVSDWTGIRLPN